MTIRTTNNIIESRKKLDADITATWTIINTENIVPRGVCRNYDLKESLKHIKTMSKKRIEDKLDSLCVNLGYSSREELKDDNLYITIYTLSEKTEFFVKLGIVNTIDPKLKLKVGKNNLNKTEVLSSNYITTLRNQLSIEINALKKKLKDFNDNSTLKINKEYNINF